VKRKSARRFVFMNQRIREQVPGGPVIVFQEGRRQVQTNRIEISYRGRKIAELRFRPKGVYAIKTHSVRAALELFAAADVMVYPS
jgi:hypothetical protein